MVGHQYGVSHVAFSPKGDRIVSGGMDNTLRVWDAAAGKAVRELKEHAGWVISSAFSADGRQLATGSCDKTIRVWDTGNWQVLRVLKGHAHDVHSVQFLSDGRIVSASHDNTIKLWNASSVTVQETWKLVSGDYLNALMLSPDQKRILCAWGSAWNGEHSVTIMSMNAKIGKILQAMSKHSDLVTAMDISSDGRFIASGSRDLTVVIWKSDE